MEPNPIRGEHALQIDGEMYLVCLTLGALAQIESSLGLDDLADLSARMAKLSANDVLHILAALLCGGGNAIPLEKLRTSKLDPAEVARVISNAFTLAGEA
ncbi:MAG: hypothetical protein COA47_06445 [Robiginitomaculum sp.]|nr:MAG: hypothetical protein COA47_06445 [Robiginitomaculum sp.]